MTLLAVTLNDGDIYNTQKILFNDYFNKYKLYKILDKKEALVYSLLDFCPIAIGTLSQKVPYELSELFEVLEDLIQKGFVKETIPNYYIRSL